MTRQQKEALALAVAGYRVFPAHGITDEGCTCGRRECASAGKHPAVKGWQKAATTDVEKVRAWWDKNPHYNPAIATGHGLVVLDVDGPKGEQALQQLEKQHECLPATRQVITGGGGVHYYFHAGRPMKNSVRKIGAGLDIRADGGYVIAPGARHASGTDYEWEILCSPEDEVEAVIPSWLEKLIAAGETKQESTAENDPFSAEVIPEGKRNDTLYKLGCSLRGRHGYTMKDVEAALHKANQTRCVPPLSDADINTIVRQVDRFRRSGGSEGAFSPIGLMSFADVPDEEPHFLLAPYIPEGAITILQGNPGDGKTAFLCKLAAAVSTGSGVLSSACEAGNVLLLSVEDDAPILRGRIIASGGDPARCFFAEGAYQLNFLSPEVEQYIQEQEIRMVAFDPLQSFLGPGVDINKSNETRPVMAALAAMAKRNRCAVVLVSHLNKGQRDGPATYRSLGSVDIPGAARSVLHIGRSAEDPEQRIAVHSKSSNARAGQSIAFRIGHKGGVSIEGYSAAGYDDLATVGKKARKAAQGFQGTAVVEACKRLLAEHPEGIKIGYEDLGVPIPPNVRPKHFFDALRGQLADNGVIIETGVRVTNGRAGIIISPDNGEL